MPTRIDLVSSFDLAIGENAMLTPRLVVSLILMAALCGCSPTVYAVARWSATAEHHGGIMIPLTDNQAYVELLNGNRDKKGKGKAFETTLVRCFFQP